MRKLMRNSQGVTLVEVLVVLVLMSLILLMVNGVNISGQKAFISQKEKIQHQESVQYAIKYITREVRKHGDVETVETDDSTKNELNIKHHTESNFDNYKLVENTLYKNADPLVEGITGFYAKVTKEEGKPLKLKLTVKSEGKSEIENVEVETEIYLR